MKTLSGLSVMWLAVLAAGTAAAAPVLNLPRSAALNGLSDSQRDQVDAFVGHWLDVMAETTDPAAITNARGMLLGAWTKYGPDAEAYRGAFAASLAKRGQAFLTAVAEKADALQRLREVNLAIAAGRAGRPNIVGLADAMVRHANPAVRYYGWDAYADIRAAAIAEGADLAVAMYKALQLRLAEESDAEVLGKIVAMFRLAPNPEPDSGVSPAAWRVGQKKLFDILRQHWNTLCKATASPDPAAAEAGRTGVVSLSLLANGLGEEIDRKAMLQMLANIAYTGSIGFDEAEKLLAAATKAVQARTGDPEMAETMRPAIDALAEKFGLADAEALAARYSEAQRAVSSLSLMLKECERVLNQLTTEQPALGKRHITNPLRDAGAARGAQVRLGVLKWIDDLEEQGVQHPKDLIATETPTTAPAE